MGFINDFKAFVMRGNLIDFAVGVVVGGAFGKVTASFVDGIVMPVVGTLVGGVDLSKMKYKIHSGGKEVLDSSGNLVSKAQEDVFISYGAFITNVIDFLIVALAMFLVIKAVQRMKKKEEILAPVIPADIVLLTEIRDSLRK